VNGEALDAEYNLNRCHQFFPLCHINASQQLSCTTIKLCVDGSTLSSCLVGTLSYLFMYRGKASTGIITWLLHAETVCSASILERPKANNRRLTKFARDV
jgi:hypothetical protein